MIRRSWQRPLWVRAGGTALLAMASSLHAHIGSPTVFFEGQAGPYPLRIVVQPPEVIPGLAEVSVRVQTNGADHVTALPIRWNTGRRGAPPPDEAVLVRGETNLYSTQLWFMQGGAQSVEVEVTGRAGSGSVIVPVNAVATRVLAMPGWLGRVLGMLGLLLVLLLATIVGAAVRESGLPSGQMPSGQRRWLARATTATAALVIGGLLWLGNGWWASETSNYRHNRLYQPMPVQASVRTSPDGAWIHLELADERFKRGAPLVPDHGKLMHLFVVREPGLDRFAHLHPKKLDWQSFEAWLPNLPSGSYRIYGDITYETGFTDTLTALVTLPDPIENAEVSTHADEFDPDDSWCQAPPLTPAPSLHSHSENLTPSAGNAWSADWLNPEPFIANQESALRFRVRDAQGRPAPLEPYMGMTGHVVLRRDDGSVFTHLHPGGSFSMAAQQLFEMRAAGLAPLKASAATNDPICRLPSSQELEDAWKADEHAQAISFPYAFPKPGRYRLWFQFKVQGQVMTSVFDADVREKRTS